MSTEDTDNFFHAVLFAAIIRRDETNNSVHSLTLPTQLLLCRARLRPPSTLPCMINANLLLSVKMFSNSFQYYCTVRRLAPRGEAGVTVSPVEEVGRSVVEEHSSVSITLSLMSSVTIATNDGEVPGLEGTGEATPDGLEKLLLLDPGWLGTLTASGVPA